jgi:predicted amidohydrolase YtcJ
MRLTSLLSATCCLVVASGCQPPSPPADLVLKHGYIYTVDGRRSVVQGLAVRGGRIVYAGSDSGAQPLVGPGTRVVDLGGRLVLPGMFDAHCHPISAYKTNHELSLNGLRTVEEYLAAIREFVRRHPGGAYLRGRGWSNTAFRKTGPDKKLLDGIIPSIPVTLASEDGHSRWVNSKTLQLAGIKADTPDPEGGVIERYPGTREPTGTLRETAAGLVSHLFPDFTIAELTKGLEEYQSMALAFGITGVHDASIDIPGNEIPAYLGLESAGRLRMRFRISLTVDPAEGGVDSLLAERVKHTGPLFRCASAKIYLDGVVEGSTAYLKEPYRHLPGSRGRMLCTQEELNRVCADLQKAGMQIHVHAIGDGATAAALDAFEYAETVAGKRDARHGITHVQLVAPEDIPRFKKLGVVALPQPYWFMKDEYYYNLQVPYLGQERADAEYPMQSFFREGVVVASSSDYPVTIPCNPFVAIQTGMTRSRPGVRGEREVLWPEERVSLEQMIASFTINGAYANLLEDIAGSLEVGKSADLIVLDRNLFEIPAEEIGRARVLLTLFEGREAFRDSAWVI